jgi:hypothetical protein
MTFTPSSPLIVHQTGPETEIFKWLTEIQGVPFEGARSLYPLDDFPVPGPAPLDQVPLSKSPITPVGTCLDTGRDLRLHVMRDLSCAILRAGPVGGPAWEVLPASLTLTSEANDVAIKTVPFDERYAGVARMRLQARPEGICWRLINGHLVDPDQTLITNDFVCDLLAQAMADTALQILSADPVVDPRAHQYPPDGTRFAPFSAWQSVEDFPQVTQRLRRGISALLRLYQARKGQGDIHIHVFRRLPHTPWRMPNHSNEISISGRHPNLARDVRRLIDHPDMMLPAAMRFGARQTPLIEPVLVAKPASRHEEIAAHADVRQLFPDLDLTTLFEKDKPR